VHAIFVSYVSNGSEDIGHLTSSTIEDSYSVEDKFIIYFGIKKILFLILPELVFVGIIYKKGKLRLHF
jgi:hypothetical protein